MNRTEWISRRISELRDEHGVLPARDMARKEWRKHLRHTIEVKLMDVSCEATKDILAALAEELAPY